MLSSRKSISLGYFVILVIQEVPSFQNKPPSLPGSLSGPLFQHVAHLVDYVIFSEHFGLDDRIGKVPTQEI